MPTRQELETALQNADAAGDTEAARTLALALKNGEYDQPAQSALNVTPAQPEPETPIGERIEGQIEALTPMVADAEQRRIDSSPTAPGVSSKVVMEPATGLPKTQTLGPEEFDFPNYNPDASFLDYVDTSDPWAQRAVVAQRGATMGAGDEMISAMAGPDAESVVDKQYAEAYSERPLESMLIEGAAGIPTGLTMARAMGLGARGAGAVEGGVYGFNDPFIGGESFEARALNAIPSGIAGRVLGGVGAGAKNQAQRQANVWSGADTIQRVAEEDFGITLTEGQIKGDPSLVSRENLAKKGALGDESANRAGREFFQDQNEAATRAARALGGDHYMEANQAAGVAADRIRGRISQKQDEITQAYDRAASFGAEMKPEGVAGLSNSIAGRLNNLDAQKIAELDAGIAEVSLFPALKSAVGSVRRMSENAAAAGGPVRFQAIEDQRKYINQLINSAKNPEDKAAVVRFKKAFDQSIDAAVEDALFIGDDAFITAYKDARALNAQFQQEWGANKVFEKIVEREARPEKVINFVLGGSRIANDRNYDVLLQLKGALKEDPEAWQALQEAYVKKTFDQLPKDFGPQRTLKLLDDMLVGKNQGFAQVLFDDDQYQQLRRFRSVVESMVPPDGSINHSNTAVLVNRMRTSANDMLTGLHATPGMRAIGRTIMGAVDKIGVKTEGRRVKSQLNPPKGLDTRRIEQGFPEGRFGVPEAQLPGGRQPRTLQEGVDSVASQPAPDPVAPGPTPAPQRPTFGRRQTDPIAEAMQGDDPVSNGIPRLFSGKKLANTEPATKTVADMFKEGFSVDEIASELNFTNEGVEKHLNMALRYGFDIGQNSRAGPRPAGNGLPLRSKPGRDAQPVNTGEPARKIKMQFKDGRPTVIGKVYEFASSVNPETGARYTSAEIADEMAMSNNQVAVTLNRLRANGFDVDVPASASPTGANGEKRAMAVELKRQGLGEAEILSRVNAVYGKDAVHGGTDMTNNSLRSILSKARRRLRESGEVVDFGVGVMPLGAAAGMNTLPRDEQSIPEHMLNESGTIDEQLLRAMMGGM